MRSIRKVIDLFLRTLDGVDERLQMYIWSDSTMYRCCRFRVGYLNLLIVALEMVLHKGELALLFDDTSRADRILQALLLEYKDEDGEMKELAFAYIAAPSKDAQGVIWAITLALRRLDELVQLLEQYEDVLRSVYGADAHLCFDAIALRITESKSDRCAVNGKAFRLMKGALLRNVRSLYVLFNYLTI